jgi:hypothetical protein
MPEEAPSPPDNQPNNALEKPRENAPDEGEAIQGIPVEVMDKLPPDLRRAIVSLSMDHRYIGPAPNPILGKLTEKHIDKILDANEKDEERDFKSEQSSRRYYLCYVNSCVTFLSFYNGLFAHGR